MPRLKWVACERCELWHDPDHCAQQVQCPSCLADPGSPCKRPSGHGLWGGTFHRGRHVVADQEGRRVAEYYDMPFIRNGLRLAGIDHGPQETLF